MYRIALRRSLALILAAVLLSLSLEAHAAGKTSALEALGKRIFQDTTLSEPPGQACASCHVPGKGFSGNAGSPVAGVAQGSRAGVLGERSAPTILYAAMTPAFHFEKETDEKTGKAEYAPIGGLFWDGRADDLATQAAGPLFNVHEMNIAGPAALGEKIRKAPYAAALAREFGGPAALADDRVVQTVGVALAAFESSAELMPFSSKFDRYLRGDARLSQQEARGFALFKNPEKGNCIACHTGKADSHDPRDWPFTDYSYDALGVPRNTAIPANADAAHRDLGLCAQPGLQDKMPEGAERDQFCGAFKVPTLRNVAVTAPYFHNGAIATLKEAVSFYVTRDIDPKRWYRGGVRADDLPAAYRDHINRDEAPYDRSGTEAPRLNAEEVEALVAFLATLTDDGQSQ